MPFTQFHQAFFQSTGPTDNLLNDLISWHGWRVHAVHLQKSTPKSSSPAPRLQLHLYCKSAERRDETTHHSIAAGGGDDGSGGCGVLKPQPRTRPQLRGFLVSPAMAPAAPNNFTVKPR